MLDLHEVAEQLKELSDSISKELNKEPVPLIGWVNVYKNRVGSIHRLKENADNFGEKDRVACIDLSKFNEGEGL